MALTGCDGCVAKVKEQAGGVTAEGTVARFLKARGRGDSGREFWRRPNDNRDIPWAEVDAIKNPTAWTFIRATRREDWASLRYRINSTRADGVPIEKIWDFCLNEVAGQYALLGLMEAIEGAAEGCGNYKNWTQ
jgi:hypothetical protein